MTIKPKIKSTQSATKILPQKNVSTQKLPDLKLIEETAYYLAQKRGFQPGHELEDWCTAEQQVIALMQQTRK